MNKIFAVLGVIILLLIVIIIIPHNTVSNTAINTYLITLKNTPSGKGMYQQLININLSYPYGINSNGSNILFKDGSNNTFLYAWIQSINATNLQVWIKNYNNSILIEMLVLPSFENLFSAIGYLGNLTFNNAVNVFDRISGKQLKPYFVPLANEITTVYGNNLNFSIENSPYGYYFLTNIEQSSPVFFVNETYYGTTSNSNEQWGLVIDSNTNTSFTVGYNGGPAGANYLVRILNSGQESPQIYAGDTEIAQSNSVFKSEYSFTDYFVQAGKELFTSFNNTKISVSTTTFSSGYIGFYIFSAVANITIAQVHYILIPTPNLVMPTFSISPIGTAPNPLYLSNSFTISNILLMDGKVKL